MLLNKRFEFNNKPHLKLKNEQIKSIKEFSDEVKNLKLNDYEKLSCLICNQDNFEIISEKDRYGFYYPTGLCKNCGNLQQTQYPNDNQLKLFYSKYYNRIYFNFNNIEQRFISQYKLASHKFFFIYDYIKNLNLRKDNFSILEIGCGPGGILFYFKEKGFDVTGIDYDENHLKYGRTKKLNLINKEKINIQKKFDFVIISHVLEHMKNPNFEIEKIKNQFSKNNTLIYIEVPSIHSISTMYDSDFLKYLHFAHCYHFSTKSFQNFCKKNGLKIMKMNSNIQSIVSFDEKKPNIELDYVSIKKEILKLENKYSKYGSFLIIVRIIRRNIGRILNFIGIKQIVLKILK